MNHGSIVHFSKSKAVFNISESFRNQQGKNIDGERKANQFGSKFAS